MAAIAKRCGVEARGPTARCGGTCAGTSRTWSRASAARRPPGRRPGGPRGPDRTCRRAVPGASAIATGGVRRLVVSRGDAAPPRPAPPPRAARRLRAGRRRRCRRRPRSPGTAGRARRRGPAGPPAAPARRAHRSCWRRPAAACRAARGVEERQLAAHGVEVLDRVAARGPRDVDDVHQHGGALDVAQELVAQPVPLVRAFDEPGHVGDHERPVVAQAARRRGWG